MIAADGMIPSDKPSAIYAEVDAGRRISQDRGEMATDRMGHHLGTVFVVEEKPRESRPTVSFQYLRLFL